MESDNKSYFTQGIAQLLFYQTENGNLDIMADYISPDHFPLGEFVQNVRLWHEEGVLKKAQEKQLKKIGLSMDETDQAWESMYQHAKDYIKATGGKLPKTTERTNDNVLLGAWIRKQQVTFRRMSREKQERLTEVGICGK